ncbi:MAG: HsdR family type I site-specific deoxyribonuclease [Methanothermobacter sp.]|nr:HsdR family type I site-specific deoxyribonuclease [Methanothermobacter sp.]
MKLNEEALEDYFMKELRGMGWNDIPAAELGRDDPENPLIESELIDSIRRINQYIEDDDIQQVIQELRGKAASIEGCKSILEYLKNGVYIKSATTGEPRKVKILDHDTPGHNSFTASRQVVFRRGDQTIRTDIMLFINGIPLVNIELKNPVGMSETWADAYRQIKDYEKTVPELYKYVQMGVAAEDFARYFPVVPWLDEVPTFEWNETDGKLPPQSRKQDHEHHTGLPAADILPLLRPERVLDFIRNYIYIRTEFGSTTKVIARHMQYHAAERIVERVLRNIRGEDKRNRGLIWHWQGSGKTLTMIFAASKLYRMKELENPTVFFIVDRRELEEQLYAELAALEIHQPERIESIAELKRTIASDDYRGKRGLFITLIQKFTDKLDDITAELREHGGETIMDRKNVIVFIDEAHRSQYGLLAAQMKDMLRSAFFFGFTGTPISKRERDTYDRFAYPPEEKYIHQYFITDSIRDGFTVKITYQPRLAGDVHLDRKHLEAFIGVEFEELPESIRKDVEESVKRKLDTIKTILENPRRIEIIAEDIAKHFKENIDGRFKAMVVAPSRRACVLYKRELDRHLPPEYSEIVMTYTPRDEEIIRAYDEELMDKYHGRNHHEIKNLVLERFRDPDRNPRILIVTDMLLTGFDAPILQTMYLDKPLKEHRLLQAVARTNRPYRDVKEAGLIIDYIGVMGAELRRAFELYSKEEYEGAVYDMESMKREYEELLRETLRIFSDLEWDGMDIEVLSDAVELITSDEELEKKFTENYRELRRLFELLSDQPFIRHGLKDYRWLTVIYTYYQRVVSRKPSVEAETERYYQKTLKYIHRTTEFREIESKLPVIEFDSDYFENLRKVRDIRDKAALTVYTLNSYVLRNGTRNPIYESVAEKVERLLEQWREKTMDYEELYREGAAIIREIWKEERRMKELGLDEKEFAVLMTLRGRGIPEDKLKEYAVALTEEVDGNIFPGWTSQESVKRNVMRIIRVFLLRNLPKDAPKRRQIADEAQEDLMKIFERYQ